MRALTAFVLNDRACKEERDLTDYGGGERNRDIEDWQLAELTKEAQMFIQKRFAGAPLDRTNLE